MSEQKRQQVIALGRLKWTLRRIEEATRVRRETASAYLKAAGIEVRPPRRWGHPPPSKPAIEVSTDSAAVSTDSAPPVTQETAAPAAASSRSQQSLCAPYLEIVIEALQRKRNAMGIFQDLVDKHGFAGKYSSVRRFVHMLRGTEAPDACARIETGPGEEAQVDYGDGPLVRHPETGKYRRVRLFVFTLGYSRKSVRLLTVRSSSRIWAQLHEQAFERLGGCLRVIVLDNLKEGVLTPDLYDPTLNVLYRDVLAHYGAVALPCRVRDPDRKGKGESGVGHAKRTPLQGMRFETLQAAQAYLDHWEHRWADTRIHGRA